MQDHFAPSRLHRLFESACRPLPERLARSARWRYFRWNRRAAQAGLDTEVLGLRWRLHPLDNVTERLLWLHREHPEAESLAWATAAVRGRRALLLDIGANCGGYAIPLARAAGAGSRCLAFEPNPVMQARLRANIALNGLAGRIEPIPCALGAGPGQAVLSFGSNLGEGSLHPGHRGGAGRHVVEVRALADCLPAGDGWEVRLLKIDVEGYEPEVLVPFFATAPAQARPTHILIETAHAEDWSADLRGLLASLGYAVRGEREGNTFLEMAPEQ